MSDHVLPSLVRLCGFPLYHLDGEYLRESLGTVLNIPYGSDMTQHWHIAGLEPTQVVVCWQWHG